ncbi:unnamed protein product [Cyprideis torosa]|uniref:Uncharacterized protein n=1 Tax=Cyprideis torosa TaxID=163714 RepID=A0A7R8W8B8_9CRUS|nr:unnamed protein product [Cyprideis torosa]CAG0887335.1 unnamed protein product [Cyprideis torosa]
MTKCSERGFPRGETGLKEWEQRVTQPTVRGGGPSPFIFLRGETVPPSSPCPSPIAHPCIMKLKTTTIDVHPTEKAIIVHYDVEASLLGEDGEAMLEEKKERQKVIRLRSLNTCSDLDTLCRDIISQCRLIHPSRTAELKQLLYYLQNRKEKSVGNGGGIATDPLNASFDATSPSDVEANLNCLEDYIELLYEDTSSKVNGSGLILQLCRNPDNLEEFSENDVMLSALARVLREDWKRNYDLTVNLLYCFYCFSVFTKFHGVIQERRLGSLCMEIIEFEVTRRSQWLEGLLPDSAKRLSSATSLDAAEEGGATAISEGGAIANKSEEGTKRPNSQEQSDSGPSRKKLRAALSKQNQLLRVSFYLLLNLSEERAVEQKMVLKGIVRLLLAALDHPEEGQMTSELATLSLTFLLKLSVFRENKNEMAMLGLPRIVSPYLVWEESPEVPNITLRLLFNLSFDSGIREAIVRAGLLIPIVAHLGVEKNQHQALCLLYHLSVEDQVKSMLSHSDCIPMVMRFILSSSASSTPKMELLALAINLAANKRSAQLICGEGGQGLRLLLKRAVKQQDVLLMKMIRNISQHDGPSKQLFLNHVGDLAMCLQRTHMPESEEFVLECIGILGNLTLEQIDWKAILEEMDLLVWLQEMCCARTTEDDFLLEVVIWLGTMARDEEAATYLLQNGVLQNVLTLLNDAVHYLIDLMNDANAQVAKLCDASLDLVMAHDPTWSGKVREEKFRHHNGQWLEMISRSLAAGETPSPDDLACSSLGDDEDSIRQQLLDQAQLFGSSTPSDDCLSTTSDLDDLPSTSRKSVAKFGGFNS